MAGLSGCASSGGVADGERGGPNRLIRSELAQFDDYDAYGAIQRLRSSWLRPRGGTRTPPALIVDGVPRIGGVNGLRTIAVSSIEGMEYLSGPDATMRYGTGYPGGAILVSLRGGRGRTSPARSHTS